MRFLTLLGVILAVFFVLSRTQVNEHARFVTRGGELIEGTVSRDFYSGDFVIKTSAGSRFVPQDQFGAMSYEGSAISTVGVWAGGVAILCAGLFALCWPGRGVNRTRSRREVNRAIVHDVLPPSRRES